uniref:von Willebrand factor A domain-containing protein 3B isoform X1 n=1 Tax=Ciona intestinalis TaxID=7719 RepID=UPI00089DAC39|nr:von Willebrand factor A domain-containing protein 3B isoform X1 [Ciona intestinalis]|eukprot:XP_018670374.1 von Willebrand factor A domain-containing protein 3B isoform X1 [Ciona intestinalis]
MTEVDISNPSLLRNVDPIKKAVYDEESTPQFNIGHLHEEPPADLFTWAEKERGKKSTYEMIGQPLEGGEQWELDVRPLISSNKWLQVHGLQRNRLSMKQILSQIGFKHTETYVETLGKPVGSYYGLGLFQQFQRKDGKLYNITVGREKLKQIEESLLRASHLFKRRLEWLTNGSRRIFGVIQEHSVCLVLDVSTMSQTQFDLYRESLCEVIRDQVSQLAKFNMIKAQADMEMWHEQAMPVTEVTIKSAIEWVQKLDRMAESSRTGCTESVLKAMEDDTLDAVYLFAEGDVFETSKELLRQKLVGTQHPLHTVSFNAAKGGTIKFLKEIAAQTNGRFHAFVVKSIYEEDADALPANAAPPGGDAARISVRLSQKAKGGIPAGSGVREDVFRIWCELEESRNNHAQIQTLLAEIPETVSETAVVDRPVQTNRQEQYMSSKEWLQRHGLEAQKVTAFQALAACSFRHVDGVVDLKGKPAPNTQTSDAENLRKLVNAKYCHQFAHTKWKDGTVVHVHITAEQHRVFEKKMKTTLDAIQQRIDWLQQGSREVFGTILEEQVYILIDTSQSMKDKLSMVKEKIFQLMQEQLRHKSKFNLIKFDTKAQAWRDRVADVTEQNLLNAWNWVKDIGVGGSTNTLAAIRIALSDPHTHAIYLLTDGRPDQPPQMFWTFLQNPRSILAQVQLQHPVPIHTIAFNCNDHDANKFLYQLSSDTGGRYHNFSTNGSLADGPPPFESEDVSLLKKELGKGKRDLEKVSKLRARCVMLDWYHNKKHKNTNFDQSSFSSSTTSIISLASSTKNHRRIKSSSSLPQRPHSALARREDSDSDQLPARPHTSLGYSPSPPATSIAHKNHRGRTGVNDLEIKRRQSRRKLQSTGQNQAGHTKTSLLRLASQPHSEVDGWMLPESKDFMEKQISKSMEAYQDIMRLKAEAKRKPKKKKKPVNSLDIPNTIWLKKNSLVARKLTVMDVLTPTIVRVTPKYIPVLDTHVVSKVFNDVLPIAHVSPRTKKEIRLVNPSAVDLPGYDQKLQATIQEYKTRLDLIVWRKLSQEEREKFDNKPVSYLDNTDAIGQAFDRMGWPIEESDLQLLVDEIYLGEKYLQQSTDLQRTAKQLAMGGKSKKENKSKKRRESSEEEVRSQTSETSSRFSVFNVSPQRMEKEKRERSKSRNKFIDRFRGQNVIARDECDGFYYAGLVKRCTDARHALVEFNHGEEANIPMRFVIAMTGAVSCPPLKVGDYVLALNETNRNVPCYIPGMVIGTPKRSQVRDKFFTILNYDNTKSSLLRNKLVKISEVRYSFATRYIERANLTDDKIPPVDFIRAKEIESSSSSSDSESEKDSISSSSSSPSSTTSTSRSGVTRDDVSDLRDTLQQLQSRMDDHTTEQRKQREILEKQSKDFEDVRRDIKIFAEDDKERNKPEVVVKVHEATNTEPVTPDTVTTGTLTEVSPIHEDITPTENPKPETSEDDSQTKVIFDEKGPAVVVTKLDTGLHISRSPPEIIPEGSAVVRELSAKLKPGDEVLAHSTDDGWYYRGSIQQGYPDNSYDVLDCTGLVQKTFREDLITEADDADNIIEEGDCLISLHPRHPNMYAPSIAIKCREDSWTKTRFYDNTEANVPREEVYKIHPDKHKLDVDYIVNCEKRWVGEAVVARTDANGQFNLASCKKRVGNGHQFLIQWSDGSSSVQDLTCMFGAYNRRRDIKPGDCVIAIVDPANLTYLPGRVASQYENKLIVNFCNGIRSQHVNEQQSFWISRHYYDLSVAFYRSKQFTD